MDTERHRGPRRAMIEAFQGAVSAGIPIPPGATDIEDYSPEKRDG